MAVIPVYIFLGFLEAGKTRFIQETLQDERFNTGEKTLLIQCEQGEEELDTSKFNSTNLYVEKISKESDLNADVLENLAKKHKIERILIEYNGMWQVNSLRIAMPSNWQPYQCVTIADYTTFNVYLNNMKSFMADKIAASEVIILNRFTKEANKQELHSGIRMLNKRIDIMYEYTNGWVESDDIVDELPYDLESDLLEIKDDDFGVFYSDSMENHKAYSGKKIRANLLICQTDKVSKGSVVGGRFAMTCCADDIAYIGLVCKNPNGFVLEHKKHYIIEAEIKNRFNKIYGQIGPILTIISATEAEKPKDEVVYFR